MSVKKNKTLSVEIKEGRQAKMILESSVYKNSWTQMDAFLVEAFRNCDPMDNVELQKIRISIGLLRSLESNFKTILTTGKLAQGEIEEKEDAK